MIKPNGEIMPPLKCATCPISTGCSWSCLRGDDLADIYLLRAGIQAIKRATIEGRVCDDVAWFDTITTLHDYCDQLLDATNKQRDAELAS